ncbi:DNA replication factor Cdt1 [Callorhinchus milii]|nr:DNA replication factor Cdt1 [Callorhinchus milii]
MAQVRLTDYYSQTKRAKPGPLGAKRRKVGVGPGQPPEKPVSVPRSPAPSSHRDPPTPAREPATAGGEGEGESEVGLGCQPDPLGGLRTPRGVGGARGEFDLGSAVFGPGARSSTGKKRSRSESLEEPEPEAGVGQTPAPRPRPGGGGGERRSSARKRLVLQPQDDGQPSDRVGPGETEELGSPVGPESTKTAEPVTLSSINKGTKNVVNQRLLPKERSEEIGRVQESSEGKVATPGNESLLKLKARLQQLQKRTQTINSSATSSELSATVKSRLNQVRKLGLKVQGRKVEQESATQEEAEPSTDERVKTPAYQRFHNLAQDIPPGLSIPFKYKLLAEMFRNMETIVSMLFNRSETITFAKVKQGVTDMMRRKFEERNVGQIKTVYPAAYRFRQEKDIPTWTNSVKKYQLTIDPVVEGVNADGRPHLKASRLLQRRRVFGRNLLNIVKQHHKAFLDSLNPPMHVPDDKLTRWHPRFNVDEIPDIPAAELPQPPNEEKLTTAQEVLDKARSIMTPKMEKALANMALKTVETAAVEQKQMPDRKPNPSPSTALKGISQSLLDRIRAKEAQKIQAVMTRNPTQIERLQMMSHLPEIARILRNIFVAEKKPALIFVFVCNRVVDSYRSMINVEDIGKHLRLLAEVVPDWLSIHQIRKEEYLKLNKNVELNVISEKIANKIKVEENK